VQEVINAMDEDTVLLVCGDHGMTDDGNHGGAS
jgi:phosphopentomutase